MTAKKESAVKKKRAANAKAYQEAYKERKAAYNKAYREWKEELAAYHEMGEEERSAQIEKETEVTGYLKTIAEFTDLMKADLRRHLGRQKTDIVLPGKGVTFFFFDEEGARWEVTRQIPPS